MAEGCYTPLYLQASFKGYQFWCVEADSQHGRRGAEGEFPFSENTAFQDLGRKIRHYHLKAVFRRNAHIADANAFIRVCESPGPGILVHPTRGSVRVSCKSLKVKDNLEEAMGETTADLEFVEAQDWFRRGGSATGLFGINLSPLLTATQTYFSLAYTPSNVPFYSVGTVRNVVSGAMSTIAQGIISSGGLKDDKVFWRVIADVQDIGSDPGKNENVDQVWTGISGGLAAIDKYGVSNIAKRSAMKDIINWASSMPATLDLATNSYEAIIASVRILAAGRLAKITLEATPSTLQEALTQYDQVVGILQDEIAVARTICDDTRFLAIRDFMADAQATLLDRAYNLPPIVEYNFHSGISSLTAAYEIYDDAKRFREIELKNDRAPTPFAIGPLVTAVRATVPTN